MVSLCVWVSLQNNTKELNKIVYDYLTSEPSDKGNSYFVQPSSDLITSINKQLNIKFDSFVVQEYFHIYAGELLSNHDTYLTVRVVTNFASQITAMNIATDLLSRCRRGQFPTIYLYKILLGSTSNMKRTMHHLMAL